MKKSLFLLLLLAGFSAYALNNNCRRVKVDTLKKAKTKKEAVRSISPVADLLSFSFIS